MGLVALNQARIQAELLHNFNFQRRLLSLTVNTVTGGSLDDAVIYGTATAAAVKTIVGIGQLDSFGNFRPAEWTTTEESHVRHAEESRFAPRYRTDGQVLSGRRRFTLMNNAVHLFPLSETSENLTVVLEAYVFWPEWTIASPADEWTNNGASYLQWAAVVQLNHVFKEFVPRQEGNLAPPQVLADNALQTLITWDIYRYEQFAKGDR